MPVRARLACDIGEIHLPSRTCRELASVVQEALTNVRKHSGATRVLVSLTADEGEWRLAVDDDGRGFGFEGRLTQDELDRRRLGPVIVKERVRSMGGRLAVDSRPGRGSRLEIRLPRQKS